MYGVSRASSPLIAVFLLASAMTYGQPTSVDSRAGADRSEENETKELLEWIIYKTAARSPQLALSSEWEDLSDESAAAQAELLEADLAELRAAFDPSTLDVEGLVELRVFEHRVEQQLRDHSLREDSFVFTSTSGPHQNVAAFLNLGISRTPDGTPPGRQAGEAFVTRLESVDAYLDQAREEFEERADDGVIPSKRMLAELIAQCEQMLTGSPFEPGQRSRFLAAVSRSIDGLSASEAEKAELQSRAVGALVNKLAPAYRRLIASFEELSAEAPDVFGQWAPRHAGTVYDHLIANHTSIALGAEEVRVIGERELERIHREMLAAAADAAEAGFGGSPRELFEFLRTDDRFYYPNTDEGRAAYLSEATRVIETVKARLAEIVPDPPDAPLEVVRFLPEQESQAPAGMYQASSQSIEGDAETATSAAYVVNLADMRAAPKYFLQPLAYHEGLPGHHLQFMLEARRASRQAVTGGAAAQPLMSVQPRSSGAYSEGWALYSEELPLELELYDDPWSNIGRLGMEAWRAARLIVDVGIHKDGWSREMAVAFLIANTPLTETQALTEADRYARLPGQATSYMIGKLKIEDLRARAEDALGESFDLRAFHQEVLGYGSMPLTVLEEVIDRWIARELERNG